MQLVLIFAFVFMINVLFIYFLVRLVSLVSKGEWLIDRSLTEQKQMVVSELRGPAGVLIVVILALGIALILTN